MTTKPRLTVHGIEDAATQQAFRQLEKFGAAIVDELDSASARLTTVESGVSSVTAGSVAVTVSPTTGDVIVDVVEANFAGIPQSSVTDLTTDLAARPIGSGTTNTIPKWTGASVLGDSGITDDGSLVTISPTVLMSDSLQVVGDIHTLGSGTIEGTLTLPLMTPGSVLFAGSGGLVSEDNAGLFWDDATDALTVTTTTSSRAITAINASATAGAMGIRNTNVNGPVDFYAIDSGGTARLSWGYGNTGYADTARVGRGYVWRETGLDFIFARTNTVDATLFSNGNWRLGSTVSDPGVKLRVDGALTATANCLLGSAVTDTHTATGKVTITKGTSTAVAAHANTVLEIEDNDVAYLTLRGINGQSKALLFSRSENFNDGTIIYDNSAFARGFIFQTAATSAMSISSSQNVRIGSTLADPGVRLRVDGAFTATGNCILGDASGDAHSLTGTLNLNATAGSNGQIAQISGGVPVWGAASTAGIPTGTGTANTLVKWTGASTQGDSAVTDNGTTTSVGSTFRVTNATGTFASDGNATLGASNANSVAVAGLMYGTGDNTYLGWDAQSAARIGFTKKAGAVGKLTYGSGNSFAIAQSSGTGIQATNTFTDRMVIDSSGNTTFTGALTVAGAASLNGSNAIGNNTATDNHTISGRTLTCSSTVSAFTGSESAYGFSRSGTLDTTGAALTSGGLNVGVTTTRSAGANDLTNRAALFSASGAQVNIAIRTDFGDNYFNVGGGNTGVGYSSGATLGAKLDVSGTFRATGNVTLGTSGTDTLTVNSLTDFNAGVGFFAGLSTTYIGSTDSLADVFIESRGGGNGRIYLDSDNIEIGATTQGAAVGALGDGNLLLNGTLKVSNTAATISSGTGTPEGAVTAEVGSLYMRTDGGAGTSLYVKESGSGNTGWVAK